MCVSVCQTFILLLDFDSVYFSIAMGGTLAHEMMHAWLKLQGCKPWEWERRVEEGICQVMKYKWMEWFCSSSDFDSWYKTNEQAQYARKLKEYQVQVMERWVDKVYGQGFRDAMKAVEMFGFETTLHYIVEKGKFPRSQPPPVPIPRTPRDERWKGAVCAVAHIALVFLLMKAR
ncbi:putative protein DA1 [Rosa chinensis]|uniref:Protein DA1-like domain-containing protein n=1 Tax=Rosa chinensis TaxID=74649 RepID=A0A2P6PTV2_ROSCH|nr:putative protein DA1 [Rosa chinensis]